MAQNVRWGGACEISMTPSTSCGFWQAASDGAVEVAMQVMTEDTIQQDEAEGALEDAYTIIVNGYPGCCGLTPQFCSVLTRCCVVLSAS